MEWRRIQLRLKELGFDPGPIDGIVGPLTRGAVRRFQATRGVIVKWPGTVGPKTLAALFPDGDDPGPEPTVPLPWMIEGFRKRGLHEVYDYGVLSAWLRRWGGYLGDPRELPWCGDFVETCFAKTLPEEPLPENPYLARNWSKFGEHSLPTVGAVMVFWRGSPRGWSGHVGFAVGQNERNYMVLGGNQRNRISVAPISRGRFLEARWPSTFDRLPIRLPYMANNGKISINEL